MLNTTPGKWHFLCVKKCACAARLLHCERRQTKWFHSSRIGISSDIEIIFLFLPFYMTLWQFVAHLCHFSISHGLSAISVSGKNFGSKAHRGFHNQQTWSVPHFHPNPFQDASGYLGNHLGRSLEGKPFQVDWRVISLTPLDIFLKWRRGIDLPLDL